MNVLKELPEALDIRERRRRLDFVDIPSKYVREIRSAPTLPAIGLAGGVFHVGKGADPTIATPTSDIPFEVLANKPMNP